MKIASFFTRNASAGEDAAGSPSGRTGSNDMKLAVVGSPNVGKSLLFHRLTGTYVTVSNYPGTTVEVTRGKGNMGGKEVEVIDTPGVYSLLPITEEERVTRTLPTRRERIIATLLLALAVPCSAQLGVILALFEGHPGGLWIWLGVIFLVFLLVGFLSSKVLPGERPSFYMEIPPLRLPRASNLLLKTYTRVHWYFKEIFPLFILASVFIWLGQITGLFGALVGALEYPVRLLGLPDQAAVSFLFGFFRRDYGVAGFYDLKKMGLLDGRQLVVASVTLTLFVPCVAQFLMNVKERGMRVGVGLSLFVLLFSFGSGYLVHAALNTLGIRP